MRNSTPTLVLALVGGLAGGVALAQAAASPPAPGAVADAAVPPPPGGPGAPPPPGGRPPPPPAPGAHVVLDRSADGVVHVDVKCAERDSTQDCAGIADRMLDKTAGR